MPSPHVLVIDDSPHVLDVLTLLLEEEGCAVRATESLAGLLDHLAEHEPDLVLLDLHLPGTGMPELQAAVRLMRSVDVPRVIVCSGSGTDEREAAAHSLGADGHVSKSDARALVAEVCRWIGTPSAP